jgi:DNA-binding PadR family transcriptional regulator
VKEERPLPATAYAVLGLLSFGRELSGYDLKKWADHSLRYFYWSPAISNIYGELKRLEGLGYVVAREVAQDDLRNKRLFRITDAGSEALALWVHEAPVDPPVLKDHALLRVWLGHVSGPARLLELVAAEEAASQQMIDELRHNIDVSSQDVAMAYPALVENWCVGYQRARIEAFAELRNALEQQALEQQALEQQALEELPPS